MKLLCFPPKMEPMGKKGIPNANATKMKTHQCPRWACLRKYGKTKCATSGAAIGLPVS